ncbi:MAG: glycosyltransferase family 2 protein [Armatimonadota bacterium]|nr:glycosyltransferase family 2 protein [Armatimonadota bacterium]MCX7778374.1 glycosyltransferase family 2 protein [Armatimonadota bacterium]MDW8026369.1 glycosyltransferase family 2 protein [Armatimonadota bacterium]
MDGVGVVIPAYNEAERIEAVLNAVLNASCVSQVVVVDDGSEDGTYDVVSKYAESDGVELTRLPSNRGKAMAVWVGVHHIRQSIVVMLDADLIGLLPSHIELLAEPIWLGEADMTIGVFRKGRWVTDWSHRLAPSISGQRGMRRELLLKLPSPDGVGYGLEAFLNRWANRCGWRVKHIILEGVSHFTKEEKLGFAKALIARSQMYWEIGKTFWYRFTTDGNEKRGDRPSDAP